MSSSPATAEQPRHDDPTSTTAQFAAITADFHLPAVPVRQGFGDNPDLAARDALDARAKSVTAGAQRASRATRARIAAKPVVRSTRAKVVKAVTTGAGRHRAAPAARTSTSRVHRTAAARTVVHKKTVKKVHKVVARAKARGGMSAVVAFARAHVGHRYGGKWDCSGFTMQAYARAGINLPHSSRAQAARARSISRSQARPGDLVVGPGHVGIYMGNGMMIDAGNHRVGVIYRRMYAGLHVERL